MPANGEGARTVTYTAAKCLVAIVLSGCTTLPVLPQDYQLHLNEVVDNVRCQVTSQAESVHFINEKPGWTAGLALEVSILNSAAASASANLDIPLTPGTALPAIVATRAGTANRYVSLEFKEYFPLKRPYACDPESAGSKPLLAGNLGIGNWLGLVQQVITEQRLKDPEFSPRVVSTIVNFTIVTTGELGSSFTLIPVGDKVFGAGAQIGGSKTAIHTLTVTLTRNPADEDPLEVVIVDDLRGKEKTMIPRSLREKNASRNDAQTLIDRLRNNRLPQ